MDVAEIRTEPFIGWDEAFEHVATLPAGEAARDLAKLVTNLMAAGDGQFSRVHDLTSTNLHVVQRLLLERWRDEGWRALAAPAIAGVFNAQSTPGFFRLLRGLSGARQTHDALARDPNVPPLDRIIRALWFTALEQRFQNRAAKHEIARAWIMYRHLWPELVASDPTKFPAPFASAFSSLPYALFLLMSMLHVEGFAENVQVLFERTTMSTAALDSFLELYTDPVQTVLAKHPVREYPRDLLNPFGEFPVLRIDERRLIVPDPTTLFGALDFRLLRQALASAMHSYLQPADREYGFQAASRTFGFVFESYARLLLASCSKSVRSEFRYRRNNSFVDSPDAFVVGMQPLVLEFKAMRFPFDLEKAGTLEGFRQWLTELTGGKDGRRAFEQGASFFRDVAAGLTPGFAPMSLDNAIYAVVAYEDVPSCANWERVRARLWPSGSLGADEAKLLARMVFISMRDLETAATVAESERESGRVFDLGSAMKMWRDSITRGATLEDLSEGRLPDGFRDYLLRRYPEASERFVSFLRTAWDEFQQAALEVGFSE